jgi:hypothetical protein
MTKKAYAVEQFGGGEIKYFSSEEHALEFTECENIDHGKWVWIRNEELDLP